MCGIVGYVGSRPAASHLTQSNLCRADQPFALPYLDSALDMPSAKLCYPCYRPERKAVGGEVLHAAGAVAQHANIECGAIDSRDCRINR